jgi:hypothetical protein
MQKLSKSEQSRINGAKSRGAKTAAGKQRAAAANAARAIYGSHAVILSHESLPAYDELTHLYVQMFEPRNQLEMDLVEQLIGIQWNIKRLTAIRTSLLRQETARQLLRPSETIGPLSIVDAMSIAYETNANRLAASRQLIADEKHLFRLRRDVLNQLQKCQTKFPLPNRSTKFLKIIDFPQNRPSHRNPPQPENLGSEPTETLFSEEPASWTNTLEDLEPHGHLYLDGLQ